MEAVKLRSYTVNEWNCTRCNIRNQEGGLGGQKKEVVTCSACKKEHKADWGE